MLFKTLFVVLGLGKKPLSSVSNKFCLTELAVLRHCGAILLTNYYENGPIARVSQQKLLKNIFYMFY